MRTRVVNLKHEPYDVYIGRADGVENGYFGNPFSLKDPRDNTERQSVIERFSKYFNARVLRDLDFAARVLALRGLRLGCWCKPLPCHGDVIVEWIEAHPGNPQGGA